MNACIENNIIKARWLLLFLFIIGYAVTYSRFLESASHYLILNGAAVLSFAILLSQIKYYDKKYAAIWLTLAVFLMVYFVRFYWIVIDPLPVKVMLSTPVYEIMILDEALFQGFRVSVISFVTLCLSLSILLFVSMMMKSPIQKPENLSADLDFHWFTAKSLVIFLPILMLILAYISHKYKIGEMGADSGEPLPYRFKGVIFYARFIMLPLLIIWLIHLSVRSGHILISRLGIALLVMHGVIDMLLRGSRSSLLLSILLLVFFIIAGGLKLRRNEKILALFILLAGLFMIPVMTEYRMYRVVENLPVMDALLTSLSAIGSDVVGTLLRGIEFVLFRMPGVEAISSMVGLDAEPLGMRAIEVLHDEQGVAGYLTHEVYGITREATTLSAPGFIGWFYLVGGVPATIVGSTVLAITIVVGWALLGGKHLKSLPVIQTFFLWMLFHAITEGTLDSMMYMLVVGVFTLFIIEIVIMRLGKNIIYNRFSHS